MCWENTRMSSWHIVCSCCCALRGSPVAAVCCSCNYIFEQVCTSLCAAYSCHCRKVQTKQKRTQTQTHWRGWFQLKGFYLKWSAGVRLEDDGTKEANKVWQNRSRTLVRDRQQAGLCFTNRRKENIWWQRSNVGKTGERAQEPGMYGDLTR